MNECLSTDRTAAAQRISAESTPYFYDQRAAVELLRLRRWKDGLYCPRCGSLDVREVKTTRILEGFACRECRYNFTTVANTIFHASLLPLYVRFQMVVAFELEPEISISRMSRVFNTLYRTAARQIAALRPFPRNGFAGKADRYLPFENFSSMAAFLEQPGIVFHPPLFEERLDQLIAPAGRAMRRPGYVRTPAA